MSHSRYSTVLRLLLLLVTLVSGAFWVAGVSDDLKSQLEPQQYAREPFRIDPYTHEVEHLQIHPVQGMLPEHAIVEMLDGQGYSGLGQWNLDLRQARPGETMTVGFLVANGGANQRGSMEIMLQPKSPTPPTTHEKVIIWQQFAVFQLLPLCCLLIGCWVVFVKPDEPNAWLLMGLLSVPVVLLVGPGRAGATWLFLQDSYSSLIQRMGPALLLPFAIYFPSVRASTVARRGRSG